MADILVINFEDFRNLLEFPRKPDNINLTTRLDDVDRSITFFVLLSHCWLRGWEGADGYDGRPHPDNADNDKFHLCVEGILKAWSSLADEMQQCYIWLDFGCINQDADPAAELKQLDKIVQMSDCMLTPIVDKDHATWNLARSSVGYIIDYKAKLWLDGQYAYLNRSWCRMEMAYAANIPLQDDVNNVRKSKFRAGLRIAAEAGRRLHLIFGTKQSAKGWQPYALPPLDSSYLDQFHPSTGSITKESDREKIKVLMEELRPHIKCYVSEYDGERDEDGENHGRGTFRYENGDIYIGEWEHGVRQGEGTMHFADGSYYKGRWESDQRDGRGQHIYANGDEFIGQYRGGKRHGEGKLVLASGDSYTGPYEDGQRHGRGRYTLACGTSFYGLFEQGRRLGDVAISSACSFPAFPGCQGCKSTTDLCTVQPTTRFIYEGIWRDDDETGRVFVNIFSSFCADDHRLAACHGCHEFTGKIGTDISTWQPSIKASSTR